VQSADFFKETGPEIADFGPRPAGQPLAAG